MLRVVAHERVAHVVAAGDAFVPCARELALAEEQAGEHRDAGEEDVRAAAGLGDDGEDERRERDHVHEDLLHESELASLAEERRQTKTPRRLGQRGDETAEEDHVRTRIPDRR